MSEPEGEVEIQNVPGKCDGRFWKVLVEMFQLKGEMTDYKE